MPEAKTSSSPESTSPDYVGLIKFLIEPFLEIPDALHVNCEQANHSKRVWLRVAFEEGERGRVWGRGGRNIQAIRTLLEAAARAANQSVYLDIYGSQDERNRHEERSEDASEETNKNRRPRPQRSPVSKPATRSRSH